MGKFTNWLYETFRTSKRCPAVVAAATKMEWLEPRVLLSGATWQGPTIPLGPESAPYGDAGTVVAGAVDTSTGAATLTGSTYQDLVGVPPNPATLAFSDWCNGLLAARQGEIVAPTATYYFAASGDDATGDGSMAHPWQSIAKANLMLAQDGTGCLFNRGDEWPSSSGLDLAGENTSVGSYGDASKPKPLIHCFTHAIAASTDWTQVNGTNDYTYAINTGSPAIVVAGTGTIGGASANGTYSPVGTYNGQITYQNSANGFWFWNIPVWGNMWLLTDAPPGHSPDNYWYANGAIVPGYYSFNNSANGTADNGASGLTTGWLMPAWIRDKARRFDAYAWMGTAAAMTAGAGQAGAIAAAIDLVENTPYSWFYDPTTYLLHVNAGGASPATIDWEWSDATAIAHNGVQIEKSGYVFGLRTDGWGCGAALGGGVNQNWGILFSGGIGTHAVVEDCEAYYNGRHNIGETGAGYNALTVINCVTGYTNNTDGEGTSAYVGYSTEGSNETILWNCAVHFGDLPWAGGPLSGWTQSNAVITHAGQGMYRNIGLSLVQGLTVTGETDWHNATWDNGALGFADGSSPGNNNDITTLRAWAVGCSYEVPSSPTCGNGIPDKAVSINCRQRVTLTAASAVKATRAILVGFGWSINESIDIIDPDGGPTGTRYLATFGRTINQSVRVTCANPATVVLIDRDAGDFGLAAGTLVNCEFSVVGASAESAITIPTANCSHNAYSGLADRRTGTEDGEVLLTAPTDPLAIPVPGSSLNQAGSSAAAALGAALAYDANWYPRPAGTPSIGAVEAAAMPGDANNDGAVNVVDLGILAKYYDTTGGARWSMADFSGDGAVDVVDLGVLAKYYGWVKGSAGVGSEAAGPPLLALSLPPQDDGAAVTISDPAPAGAQGSLLQPLPAGPVATAEAYGVDVFVGGSAQGSESPAVTAGRHTAQSSPIFARIASIQAQPLDLLSFVAPLSDPAAARAALAEADAAGLDAPLGEELDLLTLDDLGL